MKEQLNNEFTKLGIATLSTGFVYVFTCLKAWGGAFDVGSITQYVGAATAMVSNIFTLTSLFGSMENNAAYLEKTFEFLDIPNSMYQGSLTTEKRADRKYEIEFKDVSFIKLLCRLEPMLQAVCIMTENGYRRL